MRLSTTTTWLFFAPLSFAAFVTRAKNIVDVVGLSSARSRSHSVIFRIERSLNCADHAHSHSVSRPVISPGSQTHFFSIEYDWKKLPSLFSNAVGELGFYNFEEFRIPLRLGITTGQKKRGERGANNDGSLIRPNLTLSLSCRNQRFSCSPLIVLNWNPNF